MSEDSNFLDLAVLNDIPDQSVLENGSTHTLRIIKAEIGASGENAKTAGQKFLRVTLKSTDEPDSKPFNNIVMLPFNGLDQDTFNQRGRQLRDMLKAFDFDYSSGWNIFQDTAELIGCEATAKVRVSTSDEYGEQNEVQKWV